MGQTEVERLRAELKQARAAAKLFETWWRETEREVEQLRDELKQVALKIEVET